MSGFGCNAGGETTTAGPGRGSACVKHSEVSIEGGCRPQRQARGGPDTDPTVAASTDVFFFLVGLPPYIWHAILVVKLLYQTLAVIVFLSIAPLPELIFSTTFLSIVIENYEQSWASLYDRYWIVSS